MKTVMIAAMTSGAGKTVTVCALLAALKRRALRLQAFKCGPDYIDPMFHEWVLGVPSRNLDLFLQREDGVCRTLSRSDADLAVIEGAMGYYDGLNYTVEASAYELARLTNTPVVLVLSPQGGSVSLAAQIRGLMDFRPESHIAALLLANCTERRAAALAPVLTRETGLDVLGFLPPMEEARFESRHLGLMTAREIEDLNHRLKALGDAAERTVDLDRLLSLAGEWKAETAMRVRRRPCCRIAVARDEAFCFTYADNLDALRDAGAELLFFSPLHDSDFPAVDGLYLPGGYPELHACALAANASMRRDIAEAVRAGLPTVAECGGFLYLQQSLEDAYGRACPMCGVLGGWGYKTEKLQRFGYQTLTAANDSLLFRAGERVPAHEFHYWDTTENGAALRAEKADGRSWPCGFASGSLYAAFPHLHFGGPVPLAERFVRACEEWKISTT